ncbi:MAG TPA: hypothetical protein VGL53_10520 [Bryobacteraceae bacterium]|jgi:hypothetical protein
MTRSILLSLSLAAALCLGAAQNLEQFAKAHLPNGMELAHPPLEGSFGPPGRHIVLLYRPELEDGEFKGTVYLDGDRPRDLPPMGLIPNQFAIDVKAVFFEKAEAHAAGPALIILYGYHRNGSESDDSSACLIYQWRDNQFVRLPELEKKVASLTTASAVRKRLRQIVMEATPGDKKK